MIQRFVIALSLTALSAVAQQNPPVAEPVATSAQATAPLPAPAVPMGITQVKTAYLLQMRGGFDQYLANNMSAAGVLQIVTDAKQADVIITDSLGKNFEKTLAGLFPPPQQPDAKPPVEEGEEANGSTGLSVKSSSADRPSSFQSGRGNIFMVDPRAHSVVWSTYIRPKSGASADLDKAAREIVKRFADQLKKAGASQ